jgi:hypothetical protein
VLRTSTSSNLANPTLVRVRRPSGSYRLIALSVALIVNLAFLLLLNNQQQRQHPEDETQVTSVLVILPPSLPPQEVKRSPPAPSITTSTRTGTRRPRSVEARSRAQVESAIASDTPQETAKVVAAEAAPSQATPAVREEIQVDIRQASAAGRGPVQQLADRSGVTLSDQRLTNIERLNQGMEAAHIPSCIRPDALKHAPFRIGGPLDLPILAYVAATGKCRK